MYAPTRWVAALATAVVVCTALTGCARRAAQTPTTPEGSSAYASEDGAFTLLVSQGEVSLTTPSGTSNFAGEKPAGPVVLDPATGATLAPEGEGFVYSDPVLGNVRLAPRKDAG